jgi:hypothetical protein
MWKVAFAKIGLVISNFSKGKKGGFGGRVKAMACLLQVWPYAY